MAAPRPLDDPEMEPIRAALQVVLDGHAPNPALAVDQGRNLVAANDALALITDGVAPELLEPPVNFLRVALHPGGLAPRIANLTEWRGHLLERLGRQVALSADPDLAALLEELEALPGGDGDRPPARLTAAEPASSRSSRPTPPPPEALRRAAG
jgi:hypothetical protein